jgi:hypothetical protein
MMNELSDEQIIELFRAMHKEGSSTHNVANTGKRNTAVKFDGEKFLEEFDAMLDKNFEVAASVYQKFGA